MLIKKIRTPTIPNMKTKILFVLFFLLLTVNLEAKIQKEILNPQSKIIITEESYQKLQNYLNNEIYSYTYKKNQKNIRGIYFFLSESGRGTSIGYCNGFYEDHCQIGFLKNNLLEKCQKINNENCFLIVNRKNIIIDNKKIQKQEIDKFFKIVKNKNTKNNYHYDLMVPSFGDLWDDNWTQ